MGKFIKIPNSDIQHSLENVRRQYLVGNLTLPQTLSYIKTKYLEIGITSYSSYMEEMPHRHNVATEYQYVLSGWTKYLDVDTMEEYEFKQGDFYAIEPGTAYTQKSKAGTQILFIKVPSINDKEPIEITENVRRWLDRGLRTIRKDYFHDEHMPKVNSMRPAAAVVIMNLNNILMLRRQDNLKWTLPGGTMELEESLTDCAIREVKEETGLNIKIHDIIGTYTDPEIRIEYSDGEVRHEFTIVYFATTEDNSVYLDDESSSYKWITLDKIMDLDMAHSQKRRMNDVINFIKTGKKNIR